MDLQVLLPQLMPRAIAWADAVAEYVNLLGQACELRFSVIRQRVLLNDFEAAVWNRKIASLTLSVT